MGRTRRIEETRKTLAGGGLAVFGFSVMMLSPYAGLSISFPASIVVYSGIFLLGFVSLLYGAGLVLVDNDLWG